MKIKNKIVLGIVGLLLLLIISVSSTLYIEVQDSTEVMVEERLSDQVKSMITTIKQYERMGYSEEESIQALREMLYNEKAFPENLNTNLTGKGFIFILDKDGTNIVHPALEGKNLVSKQSGFQRIFDQKKGTDKYISPKTGEWKITVFSNDAPYGWIVCSTAFKDRIINPHVTHLMKMILLVLLIGLVLVTIVIYFFVSYTIKPLEKVTNRLREIASGQGDLTSVIEIRSKDEIGDIALAFNQFLSTIKRMIIEISNSSQNLNEICQSLENVSTSTQGVFERFNTIIDELVEGAQHQEKDIVVTEDALANLANEITKIHSISSTMKTNSIEIQHVNDVSKEGMMSLQSSNLQTVEASRQVEDSIDDLNDQINRISEVTGMINGISIT